jgi:hypothetical protein
MDSAILGQSNVTGDDSGFFLLEHRIHSKNAVTV